MKPKKPSLVKMAYRVRQDGKYRVLDGTISFFGDYHSSDGSVPFSAQSDSGKGSDCFYALRMTNQPEFGSYDFHSVMAFLNLLDKGYQKQTYPVARVTDDGVPYIGECALMRLIKTVRAMKGEVREFDPAADFNAMWDFYSYRDGSPTPVATTHKLMPSGESLAEALTAS